MEIPIVLYKDPEIAIISKPSGLIVHAASHNNGAQLEISADNTLANWIAQEFPDVVNVGESMITPEGEEILRGGIVHRLDRDTSGVMVIARTQDTFEVLKQQFAEHSIHKTYRAFVYGIVNDDRGVIDKQIGRARGNGSARSVRDAHGKLRDARTIFRTISRGYDSKYPEDLEARASYLEVFPETGRTHQIRVHLSYIHHPVIHDILYAPHRSKLLGFARLALHAYKLSFTHPKTNKLVSFEAPLPQDFLEAEKRLIGAKS